MYKRVGFFLGVLPPLEIEAIDRLINKYQTVSPNLHIEEPDPFYGERGEREETGPGV